MRIPRAFVMLTILLFMFSSLLGRLFYIQIIKGEEITKQATSMRSRQIELKEFERGEILDRNLLPITSIRTATAVYCLPGVIGSVYFEKNSSREEQEILKEIAFREVSAFLGGALNNKTDEQIYNSLNFAYKNKAPFVRIESNLTTAEMEKINNSDHSGIVIAPILKRYSETGFLSHIVGYIGGGTTPKGKAGLELEYEQILKQSPASQELVTILDARGVTIQGLMFKLRNDQNQEKGSIVLTIDKRIQEIVEQAVDKNLEKGAVVVLDVETREVAAIVSRPNFSPYNVEEIIKYDTSSSLMNRALTRYYPGSLFKLVVAAAALEEGIISDAQVFNCSGEYEFNESVAISCWNKEGHGNLSSKEAFALSCNPSFIEIAQKLGRQNLLKYIDIFRVTDEILLGFSQNKSGSYVRITPSNPALGNASIGQEGVMLTPLQIANVFATVADDGSWTSPSIVRYTVDNQGHKEMINKIPKEQIISEETVTELRKMLESVVLDGTGKTASLAEVKVAGKTATSQTGMINNNQEILNAWFAGYFPAENPQWVVVVLVEEGKSGAQDAAPVFKDIAKGILRYFPSHKK